MTEQQIRQIVQEELQRAGFIQPAEPVSGNFCQELARVKKVFREKQSRQDKAA